MADLRVQLTYEGRAAGQLQFRVRSEIWGTGELLGLEYSDERLRARLIEILAPGNPLELDVHSHIVDELGNSTAGLLQACRALQAEDPRFGFEREGLLAHLGSAFSDPARAVS